MNGKENVEVHKTNSIFSVNMTKCTKYIAIFEKKRYHNITKTIKPKEGINYEEESS